MPTYAPQDMAYLLRMTKPSGKMTKDEMDLVQNIGQAVSPLGARPVDMPMVQGSGGATPMPTISGSGNAVPMPTIDGSGRSMPMPSIDGSQQMNQKLNRLAAIQAAANQQLAGQGEAANPNMANIAKYFQGRQ